MAKREWRIGALALLAGLVSACGDDHRARPPFDSGIPTVDADPGTAPDAVVDPPKPTDPESQALSGLPTGAAQLAVLCARNLGDPVSKAFCATPDAPPPINSLLDLQKLLGLDFKPGNIENGLDGNPAFVLTGNSSSLVARFTSAINPRAIIFTPPNRRARVSSTGVRLPQDAQCSDIEPIAPLPTFTAMGFTRGEDFIELIAKDPTANGGKGDLNFFLFKFQRTCAQSAGGCSNADLLTPAAEANFASDYSLYTDEDLANTIFDCRQCHQPDGPNTPKILQMQELQNPWAHYFRNNRPGGLALMNDYEAAHGTAETYAGIPGPVIFNPGNTETAGLASALTSSAGPDPAALQGLIENEGFCAKQKNEYITVVIEAEIEASNAAQPEINLPPGVSPTWMKLYENAKAGLTIPPPYHDIKVTDPDKLRAATEAYVQVRTGQRPPESLPDIRDVFLDAALPELSFRAAPGLDGKGLLVQMCQQCHNSRLDPTISRARFRVDELDALEPLEKTLAISRISMPASSPLRMPPQRFRDLSPEEIELIKAELRK